MKKKVREIVGEIATGRMTPDTGTELLLEELLGHDAERHCHEIGALSPRGARNLMMELKERQ